MPLRKRSPKGNFFSLSTLFRSRYSVGILGVFSAAAIALPVALRTAPPASAAEFSRIYAFGDSLSDTGNVYAETGIPAAPYFEGRFSNGPVWAEYLAEDLGIPETNLAYGGARSGESGELQFGDSPAASVPGALAQAEAFVSNSPRIDADALYVIWVGANDYLSGEQNDPSVPVTNILKAVSVLQQAGAKSFLLVNLPNLGNLPILHTANITPAERAGLHELSVRHNQLLASAVSILNQSDTLNVNLLNAYSLYESTIAENGISDTVDVCVQTPACLSNQSIQDSYLFWDGLHPTTAAHRLIANSALKLIQAR